MEGLYKKVTQGHFKRLPSHFSVDLNNLISCMLKVNPKIRPSADKILASDLIRKRLNGTLMLESGERSPVMLKTIKLPKNLLYLTDRLP